MSLRHLAAGAARGTGMTAGVIALAALLGLGIPLFWVFVASKLAGNDPEINSALAILVTTGILVSYWAVLLIAMSLRSRWVSEAADVRKVRRMSWNRSFRDEPYRPGDQKADPVERLFMLSAVVGFVAFELWFIFLAGDPLPSQPAF